MGDAWFLPQQSMRISARAYLCPRFVAAAEGQGYARQLSIHARHSSTLQINGRARHTQRDAGESRWPSVAPMSRLATDSTSLYLNPGQKPEKTASNATPVASIYLHFLNKTPRAVHWPTRCARRRNGNVTLHQYRAPHPSRASQRRRQGIPGSRHTTFSRRFCSRQNNGHRGKKKKNS